MSEPIFNRDVLRAGMGISRRASAPISKAILLATGKRNLPLPYMAAIGYDAYIETIDGLTHDALIVRDPEDGELKVGDALMSDGCVLTPLDAWERGCREDGDRVCVWVPKGWTEISGIAASDYWDLHVKGRKYDKVAIARLLAKSVCGDWLSGKVGLMSNFYCTEGVQASFERAGLYPYYPNKNATPGTTYRRLMDKRLEPVPCALTEYGRQFAVDLS